jgi:hypothetical protein
LPKQQPFRKQPILDNTRPIVSPGTVQSPTNHKSNLSIFDKTTADDIPPIRPPYTVRLLNEKFRKSSRLPFLVIKKNTRAPISEEMQVRTKNKIIFSFGNPCLNVIKRLIPKAAIIANCRKKP